MNFTNALMGIKNVVDDRRMLKRVRAELGRVSSYPDAIDVQLNNGTVTLRGPVLNAEVADILTGVESMPGVRSLLYELDGYDSAEGIPSLEGHGSVSQALDLRSGHWAPTARAAVTAGLVATGAWAMMRARA
jgi:hypothetical protein